MVEQGARRDSILCDGSALHLWHASFETFRTGKLRDMISESVTCGPNGVLVIVAAYRSSSNKGHGGNGCCEEAYHPLMPQASNP